MEKWHSVIGESWNYYHTSSMSNKRLYYSLQCVGVCYANADYEVEREGYNSILFAYIIKGKGLLKFRGKVYELKMGGCFILDCIEPHYYCTDKEDLLNIAYIHFNGIQSRELTMEILNYTSPVFHIDPNSSIISALQQIRGVTDVKDLRFDILVSCKITEILTELLLIGFKDFEVEAKQPEIVEKCLRLIEKNYNKNMSLDGISKELGISKYHLSRMVKKYTGFSPYAYVTKCRIDEAKTLLLQSDLLIYQIAEKIGFEDSSHFVQMFRNKEGISPHAFRTYFNSRVNIPNI